jgi:hypothetical protein
VKILARAQPQGAYASYITPETIMAGKHHFYQGYDLEALVYPRESDPLMRRNMRDGQGYDAAIRLRPSDGADPSAPFRVFKINTTHGYEDLGDAQRAAFAYGESIIDGLVAGKSSNSL